MRCCLPSPFLLPFFSCEREKDGWIHGLTVVDGLAGCTSFLSCAARPLGRVVSPPSNVARAPKEPAHREPAALPGTEVRQVVVESFPSDLELSQDWIPTDNEPSDGGVSTFLLVSPRSPCTHSCLFLPWLFPCVFSFGIPLPVELRVLSRDVDDLRAAILGGEVPVNERDEDARTMLMHSIARKDVEMTRMLLQCGASCVFFVFFFCSFAGDFPFLRFSLCGTG